MNEIDASLKDIIQNTIFPVYSKNDPAHNIDHIQNVIRRSLNLAKQFDNINLNMVYTIAAFHDIGYYIDKNQHEFISAKIFYENKDMKHFFNDIERLIIKEAIEDHRSSNDHAPRSDYGKIIIHADKHCSVREALKRVHDFSLKYYSFLTDDEMIERAYQHLNDKFGEKGYAKSYIFDEEYEKYLKNMQFV